MDSEISKNGLLAEKYTEIRKTLTVTDIAKLISKDDRERILSEFDLKKFAKIFEDADMMRTAETFLETGMNESAAARKLYMHRNTLIYRLNAVKRATGLDLRIFDMAVTFELLHNFYIAK